MQILLLHYIKVYSLFILLLSANICPAQKAIVFHEGTTVEKELESPVLKQFQLDFDYSVVFFPWSTLDRNPNYFILAKRGDSLTAWRYKKSKYVKDRRGTKADTVLLRRVEIEGPILDSLFDLIIKKDLANVKDETDKGYGCPRNRTCDTFDSGEKSFFFITKQGYRYIKYYDPAFFEKCCPGSAARLSVIACADAFAAIFANGSVAY